LRFWNNDSVHAWYHLDHDIVPWSIAYPHIHFTVGNPMSPGQTVTWDMMYSKAKGHSQWDGILGVRTTISLTYTATGSEVEGEHIVLEDPVWVVFDEPDQIFLVEYQKTGWTFGWSVYGIMGDFHYLSNRETTPNKVPDFYN